MKQEKHNIKYSCGCLHEIELYHGFWRATDNNKECDYHLKNDK